MAVYLRLVDLERDYQLAKNQPQLVNSFNVNLEEDKGRLNQLLYTRYDGDVLDTLPSCEFGCTTGERHRGMRCPVCNTVVASQVDRELESALWLKVPSGIKAFLTPVAYSNLEPFFKVHGDSILDYLLDPSYRPKPANITINKLKAMGIGRGINYFYTNFDKLMETLLTGNVHKNFTKRKDEVMKFVNMYRHLIFSTVLPLPSKMCFVLEDTATGKYFDKTMLGIVNAVRTINSLDHAIVPATQKIKETRTAWTIKQFAEFYVRFFDNVHGRKPGMYRKQVYGTRLHFTGRAVITSITDPHRYDEVHLPWGLSVLLLKAHIHNKLLKLGYTPDECQALIYEHVTVYSPLLDEIFCELIAESVDGLGIPIILHRNPTLVRLSAQRLLVTRVKTSPQINTVSMSVLCLAGPNADFDGDELNIMLSLDEHVDRHMKRLSPHHGVLSLREVRKISGAVKIPAPVLATVANWMYSDD